MEHKSVYHGPQMKIGNVMLPYYDKDAASERRIEISLGLDFVSRFSSDTIVEVGAVLPTHEPVQHDVVDLYDKYEKSIRQDATTYNYTGKNVLAISTIEHIGTDDYLDGKFRGVNEHKILDPDSAFVCLEKIIKESKKYLITFPIAWNRELEKRLTGTSYQRIVMARDGGNNWVYRCSKDDFEFDYGKPFDYANAICIITNIEDYLYDYDRIESILK